MGSRSWGDWQAAYSPGEQRFRLEKYVEVLCEMDQSVERILNFMARPDETVDGRLPVEIKIEVLDGNPELARSILDDYWRAYEKAKQGRDEDSGRYQTALDDLAGALLRVCYQHRDLIGTDEILAQFEPYPDHGLLAAAIDAAPLVAASLEDAEAENWTEFALALRSSRAYELRRAGRYEEAVSELGRLRAAHEERGELRELSRILWQHGYVEFMRGETELAVELFRASGRYAVDADHLVGADIAEFNEALARYFGGEMKPRQALAQIETIRTQLAGRADPLALRFRANMTNRLFQVACWLRDRDAAAEYSQELLDEASSGPQNSTPQARLYRLEIEAALCLVGRDYRRALEQYCLFAGLGLDRFHAADDGLSALAVTQQERTRIIRDVGRVLFALGHKEAADEVWGAGLRYPDDGGNYHYKRHIALLRQRA